jgi:hypothetical protein
MTEKEHYNMKYENGYGKRQSCDRLCGICNTYVKKKYCWWTKNPEKYNDAKPLHNECYWKKTLI